MADYRIRYIVGRDLIGRPVYHSVTVQSDVVPDETMAMEAAVLQEMHLYESEGARQDDIELDEIRELAPWYYVRPRARFVYDYGSNQWTGPYFEGPSHLIPKRKPEYTDPDARPLIWNPETDEWEPE